VRINSKFQFVKIIRPLVDSINSSGFFGPSFVTVLKNSGWLFSDRFIRAILGLVVGAWLARYLGPSQFGKLAFYISIIAIFQAICSLGVDGVVVREIAKTSKKAYIILGTSLWMRFSAGCICWLIVIAGYAILNGVDNQEIYILGLIGASLIFQSVDVIDLWFQGKSQNGRGVIAKLFAYLVSSAIKVALILNGASLIAFALVIALEAALVAAALCISYSYFPCRKRWIRSASLGRKLISESWPFIISGISIMLYMRIDQIMIKEMLGEYELGLFSVILPLSNIWNMLPVIICTILAPYMARIQLESSELFDRYLAYLFRLFWIICGILILFTIIYSDIIINIVYGELYKSSVPVLKIYILTNIPVFLGVGQGLWLINKGKSHLAIMQTIAGAIASVLTNLILLPIWGIKGAAIAAVISYSISAIFINLLISRKLFMLQFGFIPRAHQQ
jgi:O-antigen/teichoic acid export membrane protein